MGDGFLGFDDDSTVVVTGAGSGIGAEIARRAGRAGLAVSAWDVNLPAAQQVAAELAGAGVRVLPLHVDVGDAEAVRGALDRTRRELPPARFLVNNAGPSSFTTMGFDSALASAVGSVRLVTARWLDDAASHGGALVNVSSVAGAITGAGANDWYAAAKSAIAGLTRYVALQRPNGIRANAVAPGVIATPRTRGMLESDYGRDIVARNPMGRVGHPADVAAAALFLLSPAASYVNGVLLPVDGGSVLVL